MNDKENQEDEARVDAASPELSGPEGSPASAEAEASSVDAEAEGSSVNAEAERSPERAEAERSSEESAEAHASPQADAGSIDASASNFFSRWGAGGFVIAAGFLFSFWLSQRLPPGVGLGLLPKPLGFVLLPLVAMMTLIGVRLVAGQLGRNGDLILTWLVTFLIAIHILNLMLAAQVITNVQTVVPVAAGVLYFGLAATLSVLEFESPVGVRTRATMTSPEIWRKSHKVLGGGFLVAGLLALVGAPLDGKPSMFLMATGPVLALIVTSLYARSLAAAEEKSSPDRQS